MSREEEKKNQLLGVLSSLTIHVLLIMLFLFVMGFTAPNPPLSEMGSGVELQLGLDDQGSGDVQQPVAISPTEVQEDNVPEDAHKDEATAAPKVVESQPEPDKPKEELSSDEESPVAAREIKKDEKKEKKVVPPKEKVVVKQEEKKQEKNPLAEYKDPNDSKEKKEGGKKEGAETQKNSKGVSQGDDKGKTGDKGKPEGTPDLKGQYTGNAGTGGEGSGGGGISMTGFKGFERPNIKAPEVPEDSYGTYVFLVRVNSEGEIEMIKPETRGLSLEAENIFKKLIQNTEFVPLNGNTSGSSEGRITFKIVAGKKP